MRQLLSSNVPGLDVGPLYEGAVGGEGGVVGGAVNQSLVTGKTNVFVFGGLSLSGGPVAGLQVGLILSGGEFGAYYESHSGSNAGGGGFAFSTCPTKNQ